MKLIQVKIRGTGSLIDSNWFQLSGGLNQFHFESPVEGTLFLQALQTLHPLLPCSDTDPFKNLPHFEERGRYIKHIQASKRTIALGVFAATAGLVNELGEIDESLYETDRIEIGRRLDYSQWMNFVELSSSTRWKEIHTEICNLLEHLPEQSKVVADEAKRLTASLVESDRIQGDVAERLIFFLDHVEENAKQNTIYQKTLNQIKRAAHYQKAREVVFSRLPLLIYFNSYGAINTKNMDSSQNAQGNHSELSQYIKNMRLNISLPLNNGILGRIESGINFAVAASSSLTRTKPIFLFDTPEERTPSADHEKLRQLIQATAKTYQCCYLSHRKDFFSPEVTGRNYHCTDLQIASKSPING